ncbi:DNA cytosine methyltransferase [Brucella intermedia]|uniref:DNA cytosine methyltransferase n=1 Tax=Brucella intermedia TaxID=94625 RepID=UPI002446F0AF|nr:DNA cytosine methyltransferase [Brucella intermedia]WGG61927.1 DNA cytosine methyltransferase [Brucella intermedia]
MTAYYNEFDPKAAAWLRELIKAGHIAAGDVDERSIVDIRPSDLIGYTQCHFFAGIGVWSYALRRAGWPDDRPVWTGSCPCQPFSAAGKGAGFTDERHLWPHFHWLIENCRPPIVFGEQVASKDGLGWLDLVQADLEGSGYASGAVDTCAAGFGAPHIRQRLYWVGKRLDDATSPRHDGPVEETEGNSRHETRLRLSGQGSGFSGLGDTSGATGERDAGALSGTQAREHGTGFAVNGREPVRFEHAGSGVGRLADADSRGSQSRAELRQSDNCFDGGAIDGMADADCIGEKCKYGNTPEASGLSEAQCQSEHHAYVSERSCANYNRPRDLQSDGIYSDDERPRPTNGHWRDADWLFCRDGKWRPVEPGTFPLAHGTAARVGRLRGYGNAIVAPAAQAFIEAYLEVETVAVHAPTAANDNTSKEMAA